MSRWPKPSLEPLSGQPHPAGFHYWVGVGTERASEAMRCAVELDGGQEARTLGQTLSRHRCVSLGGVPNLSEPQLSYEEHMKCGTLPMEEVLIGFGDQGGSLSIKTTEFPQKLEPKRVWPLELVYVRKTVGTWNPNCPFLLEQRVRPSS